MKPILRYFGAKWAMASWIIDRLPAHVCYVEPFGGSAAVLLTKQPSRHEVLNDIDGDVVTFFRVLRTQPEELARQAVMTPHSRAELELAFEPADDDLERARRFFVRSWQTYGGYRRTGQTGFRFDSKRDDYNGTLMWARAPLKLLPAAARLKRVIIEHDDWRRVIDRYDGPETVFYCDPTYLAATRTAKYEYHHEMTPADHEELLGRLQTIQGMALVSGYRSELYDQALADWARHDLEVKALSNAERVESLWCSPRAEAGRAQMRLAL